MDEKEKFMIQLVIGKMESDGNEIVRFDLLDHGEIMRFEQLKSKLKKIYEYGIEIIEEIKNLY